MKTIPQNHPVRKAISALSSGAYYDEVYHWWDKVVAILQSNDILPDTSPDILECPVIYNQTGRGVVNLANTDSRLIYEWYRMPETYRWEIVCYLS